MVCTSSIDDNTYSYLNNCVYTYRALKDYFSIKQDKVINLANTN
ncbi:protein of unknown function [Tenacibaculum aestuariivivum]